MDTTGGSNQRNGRSAFNEGEYGMTLTAIADPEDEDEDEDEEDDITRPESQI